LALVLRAVDFFSVALPVVAFVVFLVVAISYGSFTWASVRFREVPLNALFGDHRKPPG
jgi:hypothetical protein